MTVKKLIVHFRQLDDWLLGSVPLLLLLTLLIVLRIPNFFEPYWYGDEAIYLTIGNALRDGQRLYLEIIDHKTPIIYYLAMIPSQMGFRFLLLLWMMGTTAAFHHFAKILIKPEWLAIVTTTLFILLTSLPWFEGHITNGELFVMGFILLGGYILSLTNFFQHFLADGPHATIKKADVLKLFGAGMLFGLAILTKVPGILDVAAFFAVAWLLVVKRSFTPKAIWQVIPYFGWLGLGVVVTLITSVIYFVARGAGQAYLDFGLLYNFRYAGSWQLPFDNPLLLWLFSLPGKICLILLTVLTLSIFNKFFSAKVMFLTTWTCLALVGATLSNRPYPHYFLQVIPPLVLLVGVGLADLYSWYQVMVHPTKKKVFLPISVIISSIFVVIFVSVLILLNVGLYQTHKYYQDFFKLITHQISYQQYRDDFNYLMADNYLAADIISQSGAEQIFIWGTNPMLYALSNTYPTGRFTVSFHIKDFAAHQETLTDLIAAQPMFIVVMNEESGEFPGFYEYLNQEYIPNQNFTHYTLWKRQLDSEQL